MTGAARRLLGVAFVGAAVAAISTAVFGLWGRGIKPSGREAVSQAEGRGTRPAARPPSAAPPATAELPKRSRDKMLAEMFQAQGRAERQLRAGAAGEACTAARSVLRRARELMERAAGTPQARRARYYRFRSLEMLGDRAEAEAEFEAYLDEVVRGEGVEAACQLLLEEGKRERRARNYEVALGRFRTVLAFVGEGHLAAGAYVGIGSVHAATRQRRAADAAFRQALALGLPTREASRCYRYLLNVALSHHNYDRARRDAEALLALPTRGAERASDEARLGMVIERTDGPLKAARHYRMILARYPEKQRTLARARLKRLMADLESDLLAPLPGEAGALDRKVPAP